MRAARGEKRQMGVHAARGAERQNQRDETDRQADADEAGAQPGERDFRFRTVVLHRFVLLKGVLDEKWVGRLHALVDDVFSNPNGWDVLYSRFVANFYCAQKAILVHHTSVCGRQIAEVAPTTAIAAKLLRTAQRRARAEPSGERWQWGAFQVLLYGGEAYVALLRALPPCLAHFRQQEASNEIQLAFRRHSAKVIVQGKRDIVNERLAAEAAELQLRWARAALRIQKYVRGVLVRQASR